jgi:hypothetical protein
MSADDEAFAWRVIFLGASNVTFGLPLLVELVRRHCGGRVDIYSVHGLGRSYGMPSTVLGRTLPGVLESRLWPHLAAAPARRTAALITDIGNDILYHVEVARIADWVEECVDRLQAAEAHMTMTTLPVCNIEGLSRARFYCLRTVSFPRCRLDYNDVVDRAYHLNELVRDLARRRGIGTVDPQPHWYGFDAIHLVPRRWRIAWRQVLAPMLNQISSGGNDRDLMSTRTTLLATGLDLLRTGRWMLKPAERRRLFGIELHCRQPVCRFGDGSQLSVY